MRHVHPSHGTWRSCWQTAASDFTGFGISHQRVGIHVAESTEHGLLRRFRCDKFSIILRQLGPAQNTLYISQPGKQNQVNN